MSGEVRAPKGGSVHRRWCLFPTLLRDPADTLEGDSILAESPGDFGLLLWQTVRDVTLWAGTPVDARGMLFRDGSAGARLGLLTMTDIPPAVSSAVDTLHGMLALSTRADDEIVALCCLEIAAWAHRAGLPHTAVAFAQAGAVASPAFGAAALQAGVFARRAGQDVRAESWLRRAVGISRQGRDGVAYSVALVELGELYEVRGKEERAEHFFTWAFRSARRYAARSARMRAAHGLFRVMGRRGDAARAAQFALAAQSLYERDAEGGPDLLLDLARHWTDGGERARARGALRRLVPSLARLSRAHRLAAFALTLRARAEQGSRLHMGAVALAAWEMLSDEEIADDVRLRASLDLAHAARLALDLAAFTRARRAALLLAPQAAFPAVASELAKIWPDGGNPSTV
jgi:tetratricopeptide (TPR) repeat protein